MAKLSLVAGTTSKTVDIFIQNNSVSTGAGLTGLTYSSSGLTAYYYREGAGSSTSITLATMTAGTWASGGFVAVDGTNMPGLYQFGIPSAALATGAKSVIIMLQGATNMAPVLIEIELTAVDNQNATNYGMSALPAAAIGATSGLGAQVIRGGTCQTGSTASTIVLDAGANPVNEFYDGDFVYITAGTGAGQIRQVLTYAGSTQTATVYAAAAGNIQAQGSQWVTVPDGTSVFQIVPYALMGTALPNNFASMHLDTNGRTDVGFFGGSAVVLDSNNYPTAAIGSVLPAASNIKKNQALAAYTFLMTDSTNHNPKTGLAVTATKSLDGAAYAAATNAVTEIGNGMYKINLAAADMNGNVVALRFTASGADDLNIVIVTQP